MDRESPWRRDLDAVPLPLFALTVCWSGFSRDVGDAHAPVLPHAAQHSAWILGQEVLVLQFRWGAAAILCEWSPGSWAASRRLGQVGKAVEPCWFPWAGVCLPVSVLVVHRWLMHGCNDWTLKKIWTWFLWLLYYCDKIPEIIIFTRVKVSFGSLFQRL